MSSKIYFFFVFSLLIFSSSLYSREVDDANEKSPKENKEEKNQDNNKKENDKEKEKDKEKEPEPEPPAVGNFALPPSQQPAALYGFGGNIIDKDEIQLYLFADEFVGKKRFLSDVIPSVLFGITDDWSIFFNFPFSPLMRDDEHESSGFEDFFLQLEYAFYNKKTYSYVDQATVVANLTVPTGSVKKNPPTGFGSPSVFIGGTFYRTWVDWFVFTAQGAVLTTANHGTKIGDQFLYQFGVGRNIPSPYDWIYAWMIEVDGQYNRKNRIKGDIDSNSGGNFILVTPSLWVSSKEILIQFGVSVPINQNLFGKQNKFDYALNFNFAWSFYP